MGWGEKYQVKFIFLKKTIDGLVVFQYIQTNLLLPDEPEAHAS